MGDDSRIKNLPTELTASELVSLLSELVLVMDADSLYDAAKVPLTTFLSSAPVISQGAGVNYLALTPKGFAASVMSQSYAGIAKRASSANIADKSSDNVLAAGDLGAIQTLFTTFNGAAPLSHYSGFANNSMGAMHCTIAYGDDSMSGYEYLRLHPVLEAGVSILYASVTLTLVCASNNPAGVTKTYELIANTVDEVEPVPGESGGTSITQLKLRANGTQLDLALTGNVTDLSMSAEVRLILQKA